MDKQDIIAYVLVLLGIWYAFAPNEYYVQYSPDAYAGIVLRPETRLLSGIILILIGSYMINKRYKYVDLSWIVGN